jgi:hypothetical protein
MSIYVGNIINIWNQATEDQIVRGRAWYRTAHDLAELISGGDVIMGAGVLAALSPQTEWSQNVRRAADAFTDGRPSRHLGDALRKAQRIMNGEDPLLVLPRDSKTWSFYRCIVDPNDHDAVVIDRHAHDVAAGDTYGSRDRGLSNRSRYASVALAYARAASILGESPSTVQAVTWTVWREITERWSVATADPVAA